VICLRDSEFYESSFDGLYATGFTGFLKGIVHKLMEFPFRNSHAEKILEPATINFNKASQLLLYS
jgi:hypothetical protein